MRARAKPDPFTIIQYDDHHDTRGGNSKAKVVMDEYDESTLTCVAEYHADPRYKYIKYHTSFLPGPSPNTTSVKWLLEYEPVSDDTHPPDDLVALNLVHQGLKDLAAHLEEEQINSGTALLPDESHPSAEDLPPESNEYTTQTPTTTEVVNTVTKSQVVDSVTKTEDVDNVGTST